MSDLLWYLFGLTVVIMLALIMTSIDIMLMGISRPYLKLKTLLLAVRWAFFASVIVYAWLIDSHRIDYQEPGIWAFLIVGIMLVLSIRVLISISEKS